MDEHAIRLLVFIAGNHGTRTLRALELDGWVSPELSISLLLHRDPDTIGSPAKRFKAVLEDLSGNSNADHAFILG